MDNQTVSKCTGGIIIPDWEPDDNWSVGDRVTNGMIYFVLLSYLFVGIAFVGNRLMGAIEVITSQERQVTLKLPKGRTQIVRVCLWNRIVANLTIMVIGSSLPEMAFCIADLFRRSYAIGDLTFGALMGCAAFRYFIITAICMYAIPNDEKRKIKSYDVFSTLTSWSFVSYGWICIIVNEYSPGTIKVWEGLLTLVFVPATVVTAYISSKQFNIWNRLCIFFFKRKMKKESISDKDQGAVVESGVVFNDLTGGEPNETPLSSRDKEILANFRNTQRDYVNILCQLRHEYPDCDSDSLEYLAREKITDQLSNSRAFYWLLATQKFTGGIQLLKNAPTEMENNITNGKPPADKNKPIRLFYAQEHYVLSRTAGTVEVTVMRDGGDVSLAILVNICTKDGTAIAGSDYVSSKDTLVFASGQTQKHVKLSCIQNKYSLENKHFFVHLSNARLVNPADVEGPLPLHIGSSSSATVMIVNDNNCGIFTFSKTQYEFPETIGIVSIKVSRLGGSCGQVGISYEASHEDHKEGKRFSPTEGTITFANNETERTVDICINVDNRFEEDFTFFIDLKKPEQLKDQYEYHGTENGPQTSDKHPDETLSIPSLGSVTRTSILIKANKEFKDIVDRFMETPKISFVLCVPSWKAQFTALTTVRQGFTICNAADAITAPTCLDYTLHGLTLFWKFICALLPPADYIGGWPCGFAAFMLMGLLACFLRDLTSIFSCAVGIPDFITAITITSVGLCIPDIFVSRLAALNEKYADTCMICLVGTIPISLFFAGGIVFSDVAIYHAVGGNEFTLPPDRLLYACTILFRMFIVVSVVFIFRRCPCIGCELGGQMKYRISPIMLLVACWLAFVIKSSLA